MFSNNVHPYSKAWDLKLFSLELSIHSWESENHSSHQPLSLDPISFSQGYSASKEDIVFS